MRRPRCRRPPAWNQGDDERPVVTAYVCAAGALTSPHALTRQDARPRLHAIGIPEALAGVGSESLTLLTCGGGYRGDNSHHGRVIVVATSV